MKHIRLGAKVLIMAVLFAMLAVIFNHVSEIDVPLWLSFVIGALTVTAFWESD